jgi:hypothetical protein
MAFIVLMTLSGDLGFLAAAVFSRYGLRWVPHLFIERDRPATFCYLVWSLIRDFRMFALACTGWLDGGLKRHKKNNFER